MKIAYFDCSSGIAGNMVLGALVDAGVKIAVLQQELRKLKLSNYTLRTTQVKRGHLRATYLNVLVKPEHTRRRLKDILAIIRQSRLNPRIKRLSSKIFKRLSAAEAKVHGISVQKVHFHEVGAVDAIIDIVGSCIAIDQLGISKVYASALPVGKGKIKHAHGILPNPAPATAELLRNIPIYGVNVKGELVTPTGAAIISTITDGFTDMPRMQVTQIGCGAGAYVFKNLPNLLRVFIGKRYA